MKRIFAAALVLVLALGLGVPAFAAGGYAITNPYEDVDWNVGPFKANLHAHTTFSDGGMDLADVVEEYYAQGYDTLALTDHGVVEASWDQRPLLTPPLDIQNWFGGLRKVLSSARLAQITAGEGEGRGGRGMIQVPKGIEMNAAVVYKNHVVGLYAGWGYYWTGLDNDFRTPIRMTEKRGGITFIAHPGEWVGGNEEGAGDPAYANFFADILRDYGTCLGIEVYNRVDTVTRWSRLLWDNLLKRLMPEGRQVFGFANDDSHKRSDIGGTAELLYMPSNTADNVRKCLEKGAFLACSKRDRIVLGDQYAAPSDKPFPSLKKVTVTGNTIAIETDDTDEIIWIADGEKVGEGPNVDLTNAKITSYVRAQLTGEGGISLTQAFGVDKGYTYPDDALKGAEKIMWTIKLYLAKNPIAWLIENIGKLFK